MTANNRLFSWLYIGRDAKARKENEMKRYRVECNYGSRYFDNADKAIAYYRRKCRQHLDAEIWIVLYDCPYGSDTVKAFQELLDYNGTKLPKS